MHIIHIYGGGELFALVFNAIAALFKEDATGLIMPMLRIGLMVGLVYVVILMLFKNQLIDGIRWLLWVMVATNLLFLPKTTVHIHDPINNFRRDVANVPLVLGLFASLASQIGKTVTEKVESVFTLPDYMPYHQTGTVFASSLMSQMHKFRITDPVFKGNMERFVNQCVVYDAMMGQKYTMTDLQNTPNIWALVTQNASPVLGFLYKQGAEGGVSSASVSRSSAPAANIGSSEIVTCRSGAQRLNALWNNEIRRVRMIYGSRVQDRTLNAAAFDSSLLGSARLLSGAAVWADSAQNILQQEMMINAIEEGSNNKLSELGSPSNYAATKALLQQRSAYAVAGDIAAKTLPLFKNVIEALSYALFIFIAVLAMLPNGHRVLLTYCGILVWTQVWPPLYAVLNLIMTLYGKAETIGHGASQGLTLLNASTIINANADTATLAAWLSVSIPFISYGILKQGAGAFVGLASHLGSAMQSAASSAASETVSGNISMGNITIATQAYQNASAFQHQTSPSYNASQFKSMSGSGVEQSTFGDGTQSVSDQALSATSVNLIASVNTAHEQQQRLHEAQNVADSKSVSAGHATDSAMQQTASVLQRVGSDDYASDTASLAKTSNEARALQDHHNFVKDISENMNVSKSAANELAIQIRAGTPGGFPIGAGISGNFSDSWSQQKMIQKAQSIAEQRGYTYSLDQAVSAAKTLMEGHNDTKGAELANTANASLTHAQHLREEASVAQTRVSELSDSVSSSQRRDFQESRNVTQDFLAFVADQPVNTGPGGEERNETIGMMGALSILKSGGGEYEAYRDHFTQLHPEYQVQRVNTNDARGGMEANYKATANTLRSKNSPNAHHEKQVDYVEKRGEELGLRKEINPHISPAQTEALVPTGQKLPPPDFQTKIERGLSNATDTLGKRREDVVTYETQSQEKAHKEHTDRAFGPSGIGGAIFKLEQETSLDRAAQRQSNRKEVGLNPQKEPLTEVPLREPLPSQSRRSLSSKSNTGKIPQKSS